MKNKIDSVEHYKAQYPDSILLFSKDNHYEAYDIDRFPGVDSLCGERSDTGSVAVFPADNILDVVGRMSSMGYDVKIIVSRNDSGVRDIPDLSRVVQDELEDY